MAGTYKIVHKQFVLTNVGTEEAPVIDLDTRYDLSDGVNRVSTYTKFSGIEPEDLDAGMITAQESAVLLSVNS